MTQDYRVIFNKDVFQIHEVYYNEAGEITAIRTLHSRNEALAA